MVICDSDHRMLVFNVKSGLHSDVVSVKFSSGSAVQRCCFLLDCTDIYAETGLQWESLCPLIPLLSLLLSLSRTLCGCGSF